MNQELNKLKSIIQAREDEQSTIEILKNMIWNFILKTEQR